MPPSSGISSPSRLPAPPPTPPAASFVLQSSSQSPLSCVSCGAAPHPVPPVMPRPSVFPGPAETLSPSRSRRDPQPNQVPQRPSAQPGPAETLSPSRSRRDHQSIQVPPRHPAFLWPPSSRTAPLCLALAPPSIPQTHPRRVRAERQTARFHCDWGEVTFRPLFRPPVVRQSLR